MTKTKIKVSEGTKRLLNTVQKELFPTIKDLRQLLVDIRGLRIIFPLYSNKLNDYDLKYNKISKEFFVVTQKLQTPDILFEGLQEDPQDIAGFFQFEQAVGKNIKEGSRYVEIIDRVLDRKRQTIFNFWTLLLSILAIIISTNIVF